MDRALSLVLADAAELARSRGRALVRVVLTGVAAERAVVDAALEAANLPGVEVEQRPGEGALRVLSLELDSRADAHPPLSALPRTWR